VAANNIANPNIIYVGQSLVIPSGESAPSGDTPGAASPTTAAPEGDSSFGGESGFAFGVEAFLIGQDVNVLADQVTQLGMEWVKVRVDWSQLEPAQGQIIFTEVDNVVNTLEGRGIGILFTVTNAPSWARTSVDENGPPDDLQTYSDFVGELASRYSGRVGAYEVWDEPNLRRNWNCDNTICETQYIDMLSGAYDAIKAADTGAQVISAGLAPTGFNDGINAFDDRLFLQGLYADGLADVSDAVGAHPGGWANPPAARCCEQPQGVETHFESERFYFLETLSAYRSIMVSAGDANTAIWVTKFGWGSSEDTEAPSSINIFVSYTSLSEQAVYVSQAFELGSDLAYVGPMFLDNLNGCQGLASRAEVCYSALIGPDGAPRPVFAAVQAIDKGTESMDTVAPAPTQDTTVAPTEESAPVENSETVAPAATEESSVPLPPDEEVPEGDESGTTGG
jgi:hypothetical protein